MSSDRPSMTGFGGLLSPPVSTSPEPAFIAASAASQIVTNDHDSQSDTWFDQHGIEPSGETALVAPPALKLVNRFLDQLLFNFLSVSRSTSLASLRPAVSEVLKPKLAKEAISGADQELHEYLGGGEDEELLAFHNGLEPTGDWDLELVWKRTRLRCMVYSSLGDMEEEDEDFYTEQEQLDGPPGSNNRFSNNPGVVSPAVAIFLTSILEYMGEQVLVVAGQAAYHRLRAKLEKEEREGTGTPVDIAERVVVEESDMERVALDRTLGRLWRGWKKRIRSPTTSVSMPRSFSRESVRSQPHTSQAASITQDDFAEEDTRRPSLAAVLSEHEHAAGIPLPLSENDVREIEVPGLVNQSDDEGDDVSEDGSFIQQPTRARSMLVSYLPIPSPDIPIFTPISRKRSHSMPAPALSPYTSPSAKRSKLSSDEAVDDANAEPTAAGSEHPNEIAPKEFDENYETEQEVKPKESKGMVAGVVAGAMALSAAAVAGVVAVANGDTPHTSLDRKGSIGTEEDFTEEPEILTSSRISIGGRISPDDTAVPSRKSSVRSHSVHSLRLIDVSSPKSPSRSRTGSVDAYDTPTSGRPVVLSRPNSIHSSIQSDSQVPRVSSPVSRGITSSPLARNGSSLSTRQARNSAEESISEVEEKDATEAEGTPTTAVPSNVTTSMQGVDVNQPLPEFTSEAASKGTAVNPATFVLAAAPAARTGRTKTNQPSSDRQTAQQGSNLTVGPKATDNGAPPLTPLREMMEGAPDTSDGASSIAPSDGHSLAEHVLNDHSPSVSASSLAHAQRERTARSQPTNVIRSSPPRSSREDYTRKDKRPTHTSGSSSSSNSHKLKPVRTSEDSGPKTVEDKGQSFEQLIRSDQTIQYTLTPQNMRDIESPDSPRHTQSAVVNSYDGARPATGRSHSSSTSKYAGAHSKAQIEVPKSPKVSPKLQKSAPPFKPVPRPSSNTGAKLRPNAQPRDARADRESMGDFAEFIKSTGPTNSYDTPTRATPAVNGHRGANGLARNASNSEARVSPATNVIRRAESSAGRSKLQARDAVVPRDDSISDLIDFVRSGPQLGNDSHRIPRTVAPFRTTMDSDQMSGAVGGKATDASLPDPRYSQASASVNSSVNSQSALLSSNTSKANKPLPIQKKTDFDEEDMMPKRKTRRVRDMYDIDFSDEEEEYEAFSNKKPVQEESLADFLRNVPPPPDSTPAPIYDPASIQSSKKIKKKSSTPGLMSRFGRNGSGPQPPPKPKSSGHDTRASVSKTAAPQLPSHTPIAVQFTSSNYKTPTYEASRVGNYVSQVDTARNKVVQKSYQPREAIYTNSRTNDLASFLRDSEPPSAMQTQPQTFAPTLQKEESSTFQRMFGRKKVH